MDTARATRPGEGPSNVHAQRRHYNRGWNVTRRRRRVGVICDHHISGGYAPSEARGHKFISTPPLLHVMKYTVSWALVLATMRRQGKPQTLLPENPMSIMWCFVAATCVYWLIVGEMKQTPTLGRIRLRIYSGAALASGILSAVLVVSMLLPYGLSPIFWIPLALILAGLILYHTYSLLYRGLTGVINKMHAAVVWARGLNSTQDVPLPV